MNDERILYNSFEIDPATFEIYFNGRNVFKAWHQRCLSLEQAKATIDYSNEANKKLKDLPDIGAPLLNFLDHDENNDNIRSHQ